MILPKRITFSRKYWAMNFVEEKEIEHYHIEYDKKYKMFELTYFDPRDYEEV